MQERTMEIKEFESDEAAKKAGFDLLLNKKDVGELSGMNRAHRCAWLRSQRKLGRFPKSQAPERKE